jgi:hypothetical protein
MISQAMALAILTFAGFYLLFKKLPAKIQNFFLKHSLLTDILTTVGAYYFLGGTLTALFSASIVGLMVSGALYLSSHSEDFQYLFDLMDMGKQKLFEIQEFLKQCGAKYRMEK